MSKTKKIKRKTTGFDIVYRVITVGMAIAMYPLFYFKNLIYFQIDHTSISNLLNLFKDEKTLQSTYDYVSLSKLPGLLDNIKSYIGDSTSVNIDIWGNPIYRPLIAAAIFVAVALLLGLVIIGFAAFSNKSKVVAGLSGAGLICTIVSYFLFGSFSSALTSGEFTLAQLFNVEGSIAGTILSLLGKVSVFRLESAFFSVLFLMLGIFIWSVAVIIVNASDEKETKPVK